MSVKLRSPFYIRTIAYLMLFAMFHYIAGYRIMYGLGIFFAKEKAKECMEHKKGNVEELCFSSARYNNLKWTETNKEFSLHSILFDVLSVHKIGDNYIVTAYTDTDETGWLTALHNFGRELFHPDQSSKGAKSADDILPSCHKDYTTISEFKVTVVEQEWLLLPIPSDKVQLLQISGNIWRPPTVC